MSELTYEQASVLTRVEGMPIENDSTDDWLPVKCGPDHDVCYTGGHRLTPGAHLTLEQAVICWAMGVAIEGLDYDEDGDFWSLVTGFHEIHLFESEKYRVPPKGASE